MPLEEDVFLSVGSNMGDRLENCKRGIGGLAEYGSTQLTGQSHFYLTEPVDYKNQDWFANAVIRIRTDLGPHELLKAMRLIQHSAGRTSDPIRFGPRILDLDILIYGDRVVETNDLIIPHPRMHERRFVLQPMCDIDPNTVHPIFKKSMRSLLDALSGGSQRVMLCP
jgi:2-amino-4-hydroxy-6-hydroxymethyldihydropteridine diphosphokinase